ncbi:alpha/beta hydrolase [Streptomyces sp. RFCAC02]|uniref:alpha/beta fold hydrolase n=1 Tax=Streptomyces sp. RFCAC02 TaxID=2499143 RepID=UPI00101EC676|nr:alpha/beta hydrolase [Streptomyces sp. RFCAC02]
MSVPEHVPPHAIDTGEPPGPGAGAPLLLVHGWGSDAEDWLPLLPRLAPRHRVIAVDLPGHGRTPDRPDRCSPPALADELAGLLRRLGTGAVVAVGHSLGGQVATALGVGHPELVRSVVTVATSFGGDPSLAQRMAAEQEALLREGAPWAVRWVGRAFNDRSPAAVRARHEALIATVDPLVLHRYRHVTYLAPGSLGLRPAADAYLRRRTRPTLAVHTSAEAAALDRETRTHPDSRTVLWEGIGHYAHEERPDDLAGLLLEWCAGPGGRTPGDAR